MRNSSLVIAVISGLLLCLSGHAAFADSGFNCEPTEYYSYGNSLYCYGNPWSLSAGECQQYCMDSEYCRLYQDGERTEFGGFWRASSAWHTEVLERCSLECSWKKTDCQDEACLAEFMPQDFDCATLSDEADVAYCRDNCLNSILTSACGRDCLKNGLEGTTFKGCQDTSGYCDELCTDTYCASIPLKYETRWSVFGILMLLLAAVSGGIIVAMHRRNPAKAEDKHS